MFQAVLLVILALACGPWLINRWRFRHIPGPFAPPVLGNLIGISQMDMVGFLDHCRHRYGKIFKIYIGSSMLVCVADPVIAKRMLNKLSFRHAGIQLLVGPDDWDFLLDGLVGANGSVWRSLRSAWQPAFSPSALQSYLPATQSALDQLIARLAPPAASGEVVELCSELTALTRDIVGQAAYGVDLQALEQLQQCQQDGQGSRRSLLSDMQAVFDGGGVANSSAYIAPLLMFPALTPFWQWLAYHWPDRQLARLAQARQHIRQVSLQLLQAWKPPPAQTSTPSNTACGCDRAADSLEVPQPGAFPCTLLAARDKDTGQALSDEQVVVQLNTFLLAAFETTASAIALCIYFIAQHPEVEQRMLQELSKAAQQHTTAPSGGQGPEGQQPDVSQLLFTEAVVRESLRLMPPGAVASRSTDQHGYQLTDQVWLPPRTPLFGCIYCFQRDPDYWPQALEFRPERWLPEGAELQPSTPDAYMPFGAGGRLCIGRQFAQQAVMAALVRLYQEYSFQLEPGQVPLPVKQTFALVPARGLKVRVTKRARPV